MTSQDRERRVGMVAIRNMFYSLDYPSVGVHMITVVIRDELTKLSRCGKLNGNFKRTVANQVPNSHVTIVDDV
jgi:hypothetical protein